MLHKEKIIFFLEEVDTDLHKCVMIKHIKRTTKETKSINYDRKRDYSYAYKMMILQLK